MKNGTHDNGAGTGTGGTSTGAQRSGPEEASRVWRHLRAYLDTLCETGRAVDGIPGRADGGHDKGRALNLWADRAEDALDQLLVSIALARAQAIDEARGRSAPPPPADETSETRKKRAAGEDSQPGRKRT